MSTNYWTFNGFQLSALAAALMVAGCSGNHADQLRPIYRTSDTVSGKAATLDHYAQGKRYFERGRYGLALAEFQSELAKRASSVRALNGVAACYDKLGRYDVAVRYYHMALRIDPDSAVTMNNLGYSLALQGKPANATTVLGLALRKDPENSKAQANQKLVDAGLGKPELKVARSEANPVSVPAVPSHQPVVAAVPSAPVVTPQPVVAVAPEVQQPAAQSVVAPIVAVAPEPSIEPPLPQGEGRGEGNKQENPAIISVLPSGGGSVDSGNGASVLEQQIAGERPAPTAGAEQEIVGKRPAPTGDVTPLASEQLVEPEIYAGLVSAIAEVTEVEPPSVTAESVQADSPLAMPVEPTVIVSHQVDVQAPVSESDAEVVIGSGTVYEIPQAAPASESTADEEPVVTAVSLSAEPAPAAAASLPLSASPVKPASAEPTLYVATEGGDTLWHIAKRLTGENQVGIMQMMAGLFRSNPEAFIDGDMNRLKVGFLLWIPAAQEIAKMDVNPMVQDKVERYAAAMEISNGNGRRGMARMMGDYLRDQGEQVVRITNAGSFSMPQSVIHYAPGEIEAARRLAARLPVAAELRETLPDNARISVRLVIGQDILDYEDSMRRALLFSGRA